MATNTKKNRPTRCGKKHKEKITETAREISHGTPGSSLKSFRNLTISFQRLIQNSLSENRRHAATIPIIVHGKSPFYTFSKMIFHYAAVSPRYYFGFPGGAFRVPLHFLDIFTPRPAENRQNQMRHVMQRPTTLKPLSFPLFSPSFSSLYLTPRRLPLA